VGALAIGYVRDFEDPMVMVRDDGLPPQQYDFAAQAVRAAARSSGAAGPLLGQVQEAATNPRPEV
jgi:hypothetical protein